jgi:hypothetical protein
MYDEIEKEANATRGTAQRAAETAVEFALPGGIASKIFKGIGVTRATTQAAARAQDIAKALLGSGRAGTATGAVASKAISLIPTSVATGATGAAVGYGASRKGEELEAARNYGAAFAAIPYIGVAGARIASKVGAKPTGWLAEKIGIAKEKMLANLSKYEEVVEKRAPIEQQAFDVGRGKLDVSKLEDTEVDQLFRLLKGKDTDLSQIEDELVAAGYKGDVTRRAAEKVIEQESGKLVNSFADNYIPSRTAVDKSSFDINVTKNEFSQLTSLGDIVRYVKSNKFIPESLKKSIASQVRAGKTNEVAEDVLLDKIKSRLDVDWLQPRYKALTTEDGTRAVLSSIEDTRKYLDEVVRTMGEDESAVFQYWKDFRAADLMKKEMSDTTKNYKWGTLENVINKFSVKSRVLDSIDRRWNTGTALSHQRLMQKLDQFGFVADGLKEDALSPLVKKLKTFQDGVPEKFRDERLFMNFHEDYGKRFLIRAKELGLIPSDKVFYEKGAKKVSAKEVAAKVLDEPTYKKFIEFSDDYAKAMEQLRFEAESMFDIKIAEHKNYFRHQVVAPEIAYGRLLDLRDKIELPAKMNKKQHRALLDEDYNYRQMYLGLKHLYAMAGDQMPKGYGSEALSTTLDQLEHLSSAQLSTRMTPMLYSAYRRTGAMPDILRETDPIKVAESWINNTLRAKFVRDDLSAISKYIPVLDKIGAKSDAAYLKDYVRNLLGQRRESDVLRNPRMERVRKLAERYADTPEKWEQMVTVPEQIQSLFSKLLQSNLLSSPFTVMRNAEQLPFLTATEIGGAYGQKKIAEGLANFAADAVKRNVNVDDLYFSGKLPPKFRSEIHSDILRPKTVMEKANKAADYYSNAVLYLFGKGEVANRIGTIYTARSIVKDIAAKNADAAEAMRFIKEIESPALRKNLEKKITALDSARTSPAKFKTAQLDLEDAMENYLLERTQFHYNKGNISQIAEIIGPILSTFTRYSSEIQGDIIGKIKGDQVEKMLNKYLYPAIYMGLYMKGMESAVKGNKKWENRVKAVLGSTTSHIPVVGAAGLMSLAGSPPPIIDLGVDVAKAITTGAQDPKALKAVKDDLLNFIPGYRPVENWVDKFGYRAIMGGEAKKAPIGGK